MLRRVPAQDLLRLTLKQPLVQIPPKGHCFLSFRAGLLLRKDGKLTADKRKGQVAVVKTDQGATAVQWYERISGSTGAAEDFTLAEEPEFEEVLPEFSASFEWFNQSKRILKIAFKDEPDRNMFFWMQEPENDKDSELLLRCNKAIKGASWTPAGVAPAPAAPSGSQSAAFQPQPNASNQQDMARQLMRMLQQASQGPGPEVFSDVLTPEVLEQLISQKGVAEKLLEFLPENLRSEGCRNYYAEGWRPEHFRSGCMSVCAPADMSSSTAAHSRADAMQEELHRTPRSVQIWQQLGVLSQGIRTGYVNAQQFGVQPAKAGIVPFLEAVQQNVDSTRQSEKAAWAAMKASAGDADMAPVDAKQQGAAQPEGASGAAGDTEMNLSGAGQELNGATGTSEGAALNGAAKGSPGSKQQDEDTMDES